MVKINKIYTRTGDDGTTGLVRGPRRKKHDVRVAAYGTVDEVNACLGLCRLQSINTPRLDAVLARIQNDLFDLGSDLATPGPAQGEQKDLRITQAQVNWLEARIDQYNAQLQPLTSFVLPGGSPISAHLHLARTIARRAERITTELLDSEPDTSPLALHYLNRLSDLLFVMARVGNANGAKDILWDPGKFSTEEPTNPSD